MVESGQERSWLFSKAIVRDQTRTIIRDSPEERRLGWTLLAIAVFLGLALYLMAVGVHAFFYLVEPIAVVLAVIGLLSLRRGRTAIVDRRSREVSVLGYSKPFSSFIAVLLYESTRDARGNLRHGEVPVWRVALVRDSMEPDADVRTRRMKQAVAAIVSKRSAAADDSNAISAAARTVEPWRELLERDRFGICATKSELTGWLVAERLAKDVGLPMVDLCGATPRKRSPQDLDEPLGTRLVRNGEQPSVSSVVPDGLELKRDSASMEIQWTAAASAPLAAAGVVPTGLAVMAAGGYLAGDTSVGHVFAVLAVVSAPVAIFAAGPVRHELTIDGDSVRVRRARRSRTIPLQELETVRISSLDDPVLSLVSDRAVITVQVDRQQAAWMKSAIESFLAKHNSSS